MSVNITGKAFTVNKIRVLLACLLVLGARSVIEREQAKATMFT